MRAKWRKNKNPTEKINNTYETIITQWRTNDVNDLPNIKRCAQGSPTSRLITYS